MTEVILKPETLTFLRKKAKGCLFCRLTLEAMKDGALRPWDLGQFSGSVIDVETQKGHLLLEMGRKA